MKHFNLSLMLKNKRFLFFSLACWLGLSTLAAQTMTVKGSVISGDDKQPIPGVSVIVKGTTQGTVTDFDGNFVLDVPANSTLQFSFIGLKTQEMTAKPQMRVIMETDAILIDEVVSLGYTTAKKAELSSAAVTIKSDALTDVTTSDIGNMLQGKIAGVQVQNATGQPGANATIRVRGTGSITASSDPIYVVDGVQSSSFNPNDVETITVLKDAGATAIYGSSAAGGVIVVTTKSGQNNQGTHVDFKVTGGMKQALFGNFVMMDSEELYYMHKAMYSKTLFNSLYSKDMITRNFDWQNAFFKNGWTQDYYVSASGSFGKSNYFASLDYYNEDGTLINTGYERFSANLNLNTELAKNLRMEMRIKFDNSNTQETSSWETLNDAYTKMPWDNPYDANGEVEYISSDTRSDGSKWWSQDKWNALNSEQYNYAKSNGFNFDGNLVLSYQILPWLSASSTNTFVRSAGSYVQYIDPRSYSSSWANGYLYNSSSMSSSFGTSNLLKASETFGRHSIGGMLGYEFSTWKTAYSSASGTGMPNSMDALNATTPQAVGGYTIPGKGWSAFGSASYDYAKKYFLTASFRADASSMFGQDSRVGYFPSVAASWNINKESFLADNDVVSLLKLRGSYGLTGNNNIGEYSYLAYYDLSSSYQNTVGATLSTLANPELRWETAYMAAVGVDLGLWKDRLGVAVDLYQTDNKDLLLDVKQAPSTGFDVKTENRGSVRNQGIELQVNSTNIKRKNFQWDMTFNIALNKNRVTDLPNHESFLQTRSNISQIVQEGQDIYSWYMPKWLGVDSENGDPLWEKIIYDENGNETGREATNNYSEAQSQIVGKATPKFSGGWTNLFTYRGFSLSINTNFVYGNKIYNYSRMSLDADGAYMGYNQMSIENSKLGWSRWEKAGDVATHPKLVLNGNKSSNSISSRYLEDGSFFRLRNVTLGYSLPSKWLAAAHMTHCKIYVSGDNLFTLTKFSGMDPEVTLTTTTYELAGLYADNYPVSRQFLIGLEIGF